MTDGTSQRLRDVTSERPKPIEVIGFISLNRVMMLSPTVSASTGTSPRSVRIMVPVRKHGTASCGAAVPGPHQVSDLSTDPRRPAAVSRASPAAAAALSPGGPVRSAHGNRLLKAQRTGERDVMPQGSGRGVARDRHRVKGAGGMRRRTAYRPMRESMWRCPVLRVAPQQAQVGGVHCPRRRLNAQCLFRAPECRSEVILRFAASTGAA